MKKRIICLILFISIAYINFAKDLTIARDKTAMRTGPANYYDIIFYLKSGTKVTNLGAAKEDDGWIKVKYQNKEGFISKIALSDVKKSNDPFASLEGKEFGKTKNEISPASYTAAIKGFTIDYSRKKGYGKYDIESLFNSITFKYSDVIKVLNETKLAYFPKRGELIGIENTFINDRIQGVGWAIAMDVIQQYGIVFDLDMTKRLNIIANILIRQTVDYDSQYIVLIISDPEPIAFSGPGGFIFISDGLLKMLTDYREVVAVLAHEIGHIALRHGFRDLAIDEARASMKSSFDELESKTFTERELFLSQELESIIYQAVEACKLVRDSKEEYEADDVAIELLRRYKIDKKFLKETLAKVYLKLGNKYPQYKVQFELRIKKIK